MKKLIYILACAGLMAASCGEDLLDTRSSSSSDSETMFSNETYAEAAVMNIYRQFGVDKSYRNRWLVYYGANSDTEWYVGASPDKPTDTKTLIYSYNASYDDANSQLNESSGQFALAYTAIENANLAIAGLRKYGDVENNAGMRYLLGEALVLRALLPRPRQGLGRRSRAFPAHRRDGRRHQAQERPRRHLPADHRRSGGGRELRLLAQRVR